MRNYRPFSLFLGSLVLVFTVASQASVSRYFYPDYYLGKAFEWGLAIDARIRSDVFKIVKDEKMQQRLTQTFQLLHRSPAWDYRYKDIKLVLIQGRVEEPNAFSIGPVIYFTTSLVSLLDDRELTAVMAHELVHSEQAHLMKRLPLPLGAFLMSLFERAIGGGVSPSEERTLAENVRLWVETSNFAMELQADCFAAQQLDFLRNSGFVNHPLDLLRASSKMLGYDVSQDKSDAPEALRAHAILSKFYVNSCAF